MSAVICRFIDSDTIQNWATGTRNSQNKYPKALSFVVDHDVLLHYDVVQGDIGDAVACMQLYRGERSQFDNFERKSNGDSRAQK